MSKKNTYQKSFIRKMETHDQVLRFISRLGGIKDSGLPCQQTGDFDKERSRGVVGGPRLVPPWRDDSGKTR